MTHREHGDKAPYILNLRTTKTGHLDQKFSFFLGNGRGKKVEEVGYMSPTRTSVLFGNQS
jgi:hypothetical protein